MAAAQGLSCRTRDDPRPAAVTHQPPAADDALTLAGLPGSIGTAGDAYDNAQAETNRRTLQIGPSP
jgi:hypothetical protein